MLPTPTPQGTQRWISVDRGSIAVFYGDRTCSSVRCGLEFLYCLQTRDERVEFMLVETAEEIDTCEIDSVVSLQ